MKSLQASKKMKKTKAGMIPVDWAYAQLKEVAIISSGGTPSRSNPIYWNGNIPWIKTTQIQNCIINKNDIDEFITEEGLKNSSAKMVPPKTIVLGMIGQGKTRGQVGYLNIEACTNQNTATIACKASCNSKFLYQYLLFNYHNIRALSNSSGQGNLNLGLVEIIPVLVPALSEQKAIADLLFTWDEAIEIIERLVQVKVKRFKWLLHTLIKEKNEWAKKKLGDVCKVTKGKQLNVAHMKADGAYYALNGGIKPSGRTDDWNTEVGTIIISESGNSCEYVNFNSERFWSGGHCYSLLNLNACVNNYYLFFFLRMNQQKIMNLRVGSGLPNIQKKDVDAFQVILPLIEEQQQIAETLSTAQQDIDLLKQLVEKYKTQKRGLMQKMLTGLWRVKPEKLNKYREHTND